MTFGGVILIIFLRINFSKNTDFGAFSIEDEGTAGTLLVVFKMHGLQQQKTGVSIKV